MVPAGLPGVVVAHHEANLAGSSEALVVDPGTALEGVEVVLGGEAGAVTGRTLTTEGRPRPGVRVRILGGSPAVAVAAATSGQDGSFHIVGVPAGPVVVEASDPGPDEIKKRAVTVRPGGTTRGIEFRFVVGSGSVSGQVLDSEGRPLEASVFVGADSPLSLFAVKHTADDGRFSFDGLVEGVYEVRAIRPGWSTAVYDDIPAGTNNLVLVIRRGGRIDGRVLGWGGGVEQSPRFALRRTGVSPYEEGLRRIRSSPPNGEHFGGGVFQIEVPDTGVYDLAVVVPDGRVGVAYDVEVAEGEVTSAIDVSVGRPLTVRGRVECARTGRAIRLAKIGHLVLGEVVSPPSGTRYQYGGAVTRPDGSFELATLPNEPFSLVIDALGYETAYWRSAGLSHGVEDISAIRIHPTTTPEADMDGTGRQ